MSFPSTTTTIEEERQIHIAFMREALIMAELALRTGETPVGCVLVLHNAIIGRGTNATNRTYNGTRHAEFIALNDILATHKEKQKYTASILKECDLYVTVEPCIMCASLLRQVGVRRVYFGASNDKFGGAGSVLNIQSRNGVEVVAPNETEERSTMRTKDDYRVSGGWLREEAIVMLRRFYVQENKRAPDEKAKGKEKRVLKLVVEEGDLQGRKASRKTGRV